METINVVYFEANSLKHSYVPVNSKSAHPHLAYPGHLTGVLLRTVGNLIHIEALLDGHLTFVSKRWSALQAKGFRNFFRFQHVHRVHGSLLLYSLLSWSFCKPLKKPVKCGLSGMNNFIEMKKPPKDSFPRLMIFRLCLVGYLHLNKRFDARENF